MLILKPNSIQRKVKVEKNMGIMDRYFCNTVFELCSKFTKTDSFKPFNILEVEVGRQVRAIKMRLQGVRTLHLSQVEFLAGDIKLQNNIDYVIKSISSSSVYQDYNAHNLVKTGGIFHSKKELDPWVEIVFLSPVKIDVIQINNFGFRYCYRAFSICVFVQYSDDGMYKLIFDNWKSKKALESLTFNAFPFLCNELEKNISMFFIAAVFGDEEIAVKILNKIQLQISPAEFKTLSEMTNELLVNVGYGFNHHGMIRNFGAMSDVFLNNVMKEVSDLLSMLSDGLSLQVFVTAGTLLGLHRDDGLIKHDDDIDLGYVSRYKDIKNILQEKASIINFLSEKGFKTKDSGHVQIQCELSCGVFLDLFPSFIDGEYLHVSPLQKNKIKVPDVIPLSTLDYRNCVLPVPNNINVLLKTNYGDDWNAPDSSWRFNWDRANIEYRAFIKTE